MGYSGCRGVGKVEKGGGWRKIGGAKRMGGVKKVVEKYFAMVWWENKKRGGGGIPQDSEPISFFYPATFFALFLPSAFSLAVFSFFVTIVALIALMAQFYFRFSTLSAAPPP